MARKQTPERLQPPNLIVPRKEAAAKIQAQINKGIQIRDISIRSQEDLSRAWAEETKWSKYNSELLTRLFDNPSVAQEYDYQSISFGEDHLPERIKSFQRYVIERINRLESIQERLDLIPEVGVKPAHVTSPKISASSSRAIFIVHGHDEAARETLARFIEKLELNPIILHEKPNAGRTLIEKFERNANVGFAVVLLTPDDMGYPKAHPEQASPRARQNVIFELGYFLGKLERAKVCALHKGNVEILSDYQGVIYIPMDSGGAWRLLLAKEIREAGIEIDLNKAL
jgi:predicted nucleotide-binding protein